MHNGIKNFSEVAFYAPTFLKLKPHHLELIEEVDYNLKSYNQHFWIKNNILWIKSEIFFTPLSDQK